MHIITERISIVGILISFVFLMGCSENNKNEINQPKASEDIKIEYVLPEEWETFEIQANQYGGSDHSIVTKHAYI